MQGRVSPAQVRELCAFPLIRLDMNEPEACADSGPEDEVTRRVAACVLMRMRPRGGDLSQGATEAVSELDEGSEQLPTQRSERVTGHRICPHCSEVRTYHRRSCTAFISKFPLNASEMDTLQKILNSVQSGYLNSPGGPAAPHGTPARREAGGLWRGQLLRPGGL